MKLHLCKRDDTVQRFSEVLGLTPSCAWEGLRGARPGIPKSAAEMLPIVTDMFIQWRKVRSFAAEQ